MFGDAVAHSEQAQCVKSNMGQQTGDGAPPGGAAAIVAFSSQRRLVVSALKIEPRPGSKPTMTFCPLLITTSLLQRNVTGCPAILVQASVDGAVPPIPFNQIQYADLESAF